MQDLIGREYIYGEYDCYTLVRDYYFHVLGITFPLTPTYVQFDPAHMDLIVDNFEQSGFTTVQVPKEHDVIALSCNSKTVNHLGVFVEDKYILHHCVKRLSSKDAYGNNGIWDRQTTLFLRHIDLT